ncbi:MAG: VWA domain-containing protein [Planctomycetes bacterium]|nr:VWA domain-containing protein [Planctomycetota bacterium]
MFGLEIRFESPQCLVGSAINFVYDFIRFVWDTFTNIDFEAEPFLWLLLLIPLLWIFSFKSLAGLGKYRRLFAIAFRTFVMVAIILALAEIQMLKISDKVTVTYLLDQSESIPMLKRQAMLDYVTREVQKHRDAKREDCAGVIVFGHDAVVEVPPFDEDIPFINLESTVGLRTDATNLAAALKMAQATFPEDSAKRIVVVSDGNENMGDARSVARTLAEQGIGIDVVPVNLDTRGEIQVEKVALPSDIRKGQPVEARVVINNLTAAQNGRKVTGKLKLIRQVGKDEQLLNPNDQQVELDPGKNVFMFEHRIDEVAAYRYKAVFSPDDPADDLMAQNNQATAFTHVRGKGRVLFIEDADNKGEFDHLIKRLRVNNIEVDLTASDELFTSPAELLAYDSVVLANVPRSSGMDVDSVTSFSDQQIKMLVRNTEQFGCGLVMLGGPNSFGAGGWANTELEKALPVDFQIKNSRIRAVGALAMIMHASEMARGNHWQKVISREAIRPLGPMDYCGLIHWGPGREEWLWGGKQGLVRVGTQRKKMMARVDRMTPGDMPQFDPAMKKALAAFNRCPASVKHMIIISDGDPTKPSFTTMRGFKQAKVKISTVAIGAHGQVGHKTLQDIATATGGKYYAVKNPKALPRIFQIEARKVARPLIKPLNDVPPRVEYPHEMLNGIDEPLPPLRGFVMTTVKEHPLVEVALYSPIPSDRQNSTILASWTYGMGRSVALTTDVGAAWANQWTKWENYDKFFSQMIRWSMRPMTDEGKFRIASDIKDGKVRVVVDALDKDDEFLNFLNMSATIVGPDLESLGLDIDQVAPGRYVGEFDADKAGSYFVTINPGPGKSLILAGVNVPYSSEFSDRESNLALLKALATLPPKEGRPGKVIEGQMTQDKLDALLGVDTFRSGLMKAISRQDVWPLFLLFAACVFFGDVFVRRVTVHFYWIGPAIGWVVDRVLRREREEVEDERLERLRSRKAAIADEIDVRRAGARFEPEVDTEAPSKELDEVLEEAAGPAPSRAPRPATDQTSMEIEEDQSYTSRLLEAKKKAWKENKQD